MARITWQDVVVPRFNDGLDGIRTAGDLLNQGIRQANDATAAWDKGMTDAANNAILQRALAVQDPNQVNTQQILGADAAHASSDMLKFAESRRQDLLNRQALALDRQFQQYGRDREIQTNQALDQAQPLLQEAAALQAAGNTQGALVKLNEARNIQGMTSEGQIRAGQYVRPWAPNPLDARLAKQQEDERLKAAFIQEYRASPTPEAKRALAYSDKYPQYIVLAGEQQLNQMDENATQEAIGSQATLGVLPPTAPQDYPAGSAGDVYFGFKPDGTNTIGWTPPKPISQMTYAERLAAGDQMREVTRRQGIGVVDGVPQGTSAMGSYMITGPTLETYAPKVLGANWKTKVSSPENDRLIAKAIFNDRKKGDITKTWAALARFPEFQGEGKLKDKSFEEIEPLIAYTEANEVPPNYLTEVTDAKEVLNEQRRTFTPADNVALMTLEQPNLDPATASMEVAKKLGGGKDSALFAEIQEQVNETLAAHRGKVTAAEVAASLLNTVEAEDWWNLDNYKDGLDRWQEGFDNMIADLPTAHTKVKAFQKDLELVTKAEKFQADHADALLWAEREKLKGRGSATLTRLKRAQEASREIEKILPGLNGIQQTSSSSANSDEPNMSQMPVSENSNMSTNPNLGNAILEEFRKSKLG